jgi:hypothetical protein
MFWNREEKELQLAVLRRSSYWTLCKFFRPIIWVCLILVFWKGTALDASLIGILLYLTSRKFVYECIVKDPGL